MNIGLCIRCTSETGGKHPEKSGSGWMRGRPSSGGSGGSGDVSPPLLNLSLVIFLLGLHHPCYPCYPRWRSQWRTLADIGGMSSRRAEPGLGDFDVPKFGPLV